LRATAFYGKIYVSFRPPRAVDSLLAVNGRVVLEGDRGRVERACRGLECEEVDIDRGVGLPGFIDAHMHLSGLAIQDSGVDLRGVDSLDELRRRVKEFLERHPNVTVVLGRGWDDSRLREGRPPTSADVDDIAGDRPVMLIRVCGHAAVLSSSAMRRVDLRGLEDYIDVGPDGRPSGLVREGAVIRALRQLEPPPEEYMTYVAEEARRLALQGVTTVGFMNVPLKLMAGLTSQPLPLRLRLYLDADSVGLLESLGVAGGFGNELVKVMGLKAFADGSLGARTAYLSEPYSDDPGNRGRPLLSPEELRSLLARASRLRLQVAVHAIGDAALDVVLRGSEGLRGWLRVEHASLVRDDQLPALSGLRVAVQPMFEVDDLPWIHKRLGQRVRWAYRFKSMISAGAVVGLSTDAPVEPADPWTTLSAAVNGAEGIGERLSVAEALDAYTRGSAEVLMDRDVGSLEVGKVADLIIASGDPLEVEPGELGRLRTLATYLGGSGVQ
jgi:predicted amidohydrolase YtcJ